MNFQIFPQMPVKSFKNIWGIDFFPLSHHHLWWKKNSSSSNHHKFIMEFFCKLYTSSNLVIYTFTFRYISQQGLSSGQIFFGMHKIPNGFKISFSQWKIYFSQFIFTNKYLKYKEIEYFIHYILFFIFNSETQVGTFFH